MNRSPLCALLCASTFNVGPHKLHWSISHSVLFFLDILQHWNIISEWFDGHVLNLYIFQVLCSETLEASRKITCKIYTGG